MMDTDEVGEPLKSRELLLDNTSVAARLQEIGRRYAEKHICPEHLI